MCAWFLVCSGQYGSPVGSYCSSSMTIILGQFEMKVDQLRDPPAHYKIREIKDWYVSVLAKNMKDSTDHLTASFVVVW